MAFVDTLFPSSSLRLIHGFQKSIANPTTVVGNSAYEYRVRKLRHYRTSWKYPARLLSSIDRKTVANFYTDVAQFGLNSFKFLDPDIQKWNLTPLQYTGADNLFYLTARGTGDAHPIFHLGPDVVVKVGTANTTFTRVITNGVPMIHVPSATSGVTISGTFYHAARFAQDELAWSMEVLSNDNSSAGDNLGDISLIEVFEY